jgi:hypothetical protein
MTTPEAARLADEAKLRADSYMAAGSFRNGDSMMAKERAKLHAAIDALAALIPQECGQTGAEVARDAERKAIRKEALEHFRHEHGQDLSDAKKWREWQEAQRLIEYQMPEGWSVILECSPGDWSLRFTDPEGNDIRIDDYESTEHFIREAVQYAIKAEAKKRAAMATHQKEQQR